MNRDQRTYELEGKKVWVAGHNGMVGSSLVRRLATEGCDLVKVERAQVDLRRQSDVEAWMMDVRPECVFIPAAKVGGILANDSFPAEFLYDNLMIETNIIHGAYKAGTEKLLFLGSSCIYPKMADQPMKEEALLEGQLESTNQWYAVAKIAGLKLCEAYRQQYGCNFISAMPTNLYGINDNFDLETSHVLPALMAKMHEAKMSKAREVVLWGTGTPKREFLFVDDCADALVFMMKNYSDAGHINVGTGNDLSIRELALLVANVVGFEGELVQDTSKPDGTPRKLMDVTKLSNLGWSAGTSLRDGIKSTYEWYQGARV
jgi:GDP-L-fucose synthase